ncbi:MAG: M48 family metallopeptidase [Alphaproteobacteria bacterium]|nr:M48 family metallopeptidase [Alphaproteobacteria bacterium]
MKKITVNGLDVILLKRLKQKTLRLSVAKTGSVRLTMPYFVSEKKAVLFLMTHFNWIKEKQSACKEKVFKDGDEVLILGKKYKIIHDETQTHGVVIQQDEMYVGGEKEFLHRRISNFAKKELLKYICEKAPKMASGFDKKINRITLKDTTSRWGSCSSKGNLNFCFKLAFAPLFVIDYLIAHEVAHLKEMNHSDDFWQCVAKMNVEQAQAEIWLRKNGRELMKIK